MKLPQVLPRYWKLVSIVDYAHGNLTIYEAELGDVPIVEKNDLSPHSATKTNTNVLAIVPAADMTPAPLPENFDTAISAYNCSTVL